MGGDVRHPDHPFGRRQGPGNLKSADPTQIDIE